MIRRIFLQRLVIAMGMIFISLAWTTSSNAASSMQITKSALNAAATIATSGSTNTCPFVIHVSPITTADNATYTACNTRQGQGNLSPKLTENFFHDIDAAQPLNALPQQRCFKSKSFGTNTYIEYGAQKSPDVSCPVGIIEGKLAEDANTIKMALKINTLIQYHAVAMQH
jgi:hypothetical protein